MKLKSTRQLKIEQLMKKNMSDIFLRDDILAVPNIVITVAEADVSPDIKKARIYVNVFGKEVKESKVVDELNSAAKYFRHRLSSKMDGRSVPEIKFFLDDTEKKATKMDDLINSESKYFQ